VQGFDVEVDVFFNDQIPFENLSDYDKIILSPGPGLPSQAGEMNKLISLTYSKVPILGVCLGFQALTEFFGGEIFNQNIVKHGVKETCFVDNKSKLFKAIPKTINIGLYHSWAAKKELFPTVLIQTAISENEIIMGFEHQSLNICGVQFHPESIMTDNGREIINNFLFNFN
jgi:anthranilate synthase component 2